MQATGNGSTHGRLQPVQEPPLLNRVELPYDIVVIVASAGGIPALIALLSKLPRDFPAAITIVQHRSISYESMLAPVLQRHCALPVRDAVQDLRIAQGVVYLAPADQHLVIRENHTFGLFNGSKICYVSSSADPLFASAAEVFGRKTIAIVLTGFDSDGTAGTAVVKRFGGLVIVQDELTSKQFAMPQSVIRAGSADFVLPIDLMGLVLSELVRPRLARRTGPSSTQGAPQA